MGRYERNAYFERLVALRDGYGTDPRDTQGVLLIADAIAYVDAVMTAWDLEDELETAIVADQADAEPTADAQAAASPTATAPAASGGVGEDVKRAERMARLARFFDPTTRRPPTPDRT